MFKPLTSLALTFALAVTVSAAAQKTYKAGQDGVTNPRLIEKVEPKYTEEARADKVEGTVVLMIEVSEEGRTENISVDRSLRADLDRNAIAAVEQWKFDPATKDGKPVRVKATVEINFRLN